MTRSALVTGASRGIGRGIAESLAKQGYALTITSRTISDLAALADDLRSLGSPEVVVETSDMSDLAALPGLVALHESRFATMDALIVNAGVGMIGPVAAFPLSRVQKVVDINFTAAYVLMQGALPLLRLAAQATPSRGAKVIALSSITGAYSEPNMAAYGASKAALLSLVETLNLEESAGGVTASAVAPGYVETDMSAWTTNKVPAYSMIKVADVVSVVDMLLELSSTTCIPRLVMSRSGSTGYEP